MKTNWINTEDKLPPFNELVWLWDGDDFITLGERVYILSEAGTPVWWVYARWDGDIQIINNKIVAECEFDDLDIKYWHEVPQLKI